MTDDMTKKVNSIFEKILTLCGKGRRTHRQQSGQGKQNRLHVDLLLIKSQIFDENTKAKLF